MLSDDIFDMGENKVTTKGLEYFGNHYYFWSYSEIKCIVLYCIVYHYNATLHVFVYSQLKSGYCLYEVVGSRSKCAKSGLYKLQNNPQWDWLKLWSSGMGFLPKWIVVVERRFGTNFSDPTTSEKQYLSSETGWLPLGSIIMYLP